MKFLGLLIALEGIDGAGTSTQTGLLKEALQSIGLKVLSSHQPSNGPVGLLLRQALRQEWRTNDATLALLFAADRLEHLQREIIPNLAHCDIFLTDRYLLSSYAYQSLRLPLTWIQNINSLARQPDISFYLKVSLQTARNRRSQRGYEAELFDDDEQQQQIYHSYEQCLHLPMMGDVIKINGELAVPEITQQLVGSIQAYIALSKVKGHLSL